MKNNWPEQNPPESAKRKGMKHGLYRLYWKDGGTSLAAVGYNSPGWNWYQPTNWISAEPVFDWRPVAGVELLIHDQEYAAHMEGNLFPQDATIALLRAQVRILAARIDRLGICQLAANNECPRELRGDKDCVAHLIAWSLAQAQKEVSDASKD